MFVSEVKYLQRRNLGNYEHKEIGVTIAMTEQDTKEDALVYAEQIVAEGLGLKKPTAKAQVKRSTNAVEKEEEVSKGSEKEAGEEVEKSASKSGKGKSKSSKAKSGGAKGKSKSDKKDDGAVQVAITKADVLKALRTYAAEKKSKEMAQAVLEDTCNVKSLADVAEKDYGKLVKALAV